VSAGVVAPAALASPAPGIDGLLVPGAAGFVPLTDTTSPPVENSGTSAVQTQPLTPDFGVGKNLDVHLTATSVPADLDLSGARFDVVDEAGESHASCTTDAHGICEIRVAHFEPTAMGFPLVSDVAPGSYRLRQDPALAVPGLLPSTVATPFTVCSPFASTSQCHTSISGGVANTSLFRTGLAVTVRDGATHAPLAGASFSLTGADYRHIDPTVQQERVTTFPQAPGNQGTSDGSAAPTSASDPAASDTAASGTASSDTAASSTPAAATTTQAPASASAGDSATGPAVSGSDGLLTYRGWFLADGLTLTPEVIPPGYRSSGVLPVTPPVGFGDTWADTVDLAPEEGGVMGTGGSGPALPPVAPRAPIPSGAPTSPQATSAPVGHVPAVPSPIAGSTSVSAPPASAIATPAAERTPADPSGAPLPAAAPAAGRPQLRVAASMSLLDVGLIGFGVLFVALAVFGVGLMRRRARG
jgi:hypothetical protein